MSKRSRAKPLEDDRTRRGLADEELTAPNTGRTVFQGDYNIYRIPFEWCPGGKPPGGFTSATCMLEFCPDLGEPWAHGALYIRPTTMSLIEAPLLKIFGFDYQYFNTRISKSQCEEMMKSWALMLEGVENALYPDDVYLALENPLNFEAELWDRRSELATMLTKLLAGFRELIGENDGLWLRGL